MKRGFAPHHCQWRCAVVTLIGRVHCHRSLSWGWRRESPRTASKRLLRKRCGYAISSLSIHTARGRPGGITEGKRPDVGAPPRRRPRLTPRALAPRVGTRAGIRRLHVRAAPPSLRVWICLVRCPRVRTTSLAERAGSPRGSGAAGASAARPAGPETSVVRRGPRRRWPRRGRRHGGTVLAVS
jgi:hypothetical protein